jgi:hypothetical protein
VISATTLALLALVAAPPSPPEAIDTPQKVWADFDPRREPLEIETLRQWSEGGARYHEFNQTEPPSGGPTLADVRWVAR